jgi:hypothetical protein
VKAKIRDKEGVPPDQQHLIFAAAGVGLGIALSPMNVPSEVSSFMKYIYLTYINFHVFKKGPPS